MNTSKTAKRPHKVKGSLRQQAAISKIVEHRGVVSTAMLAAGYEENTAHNPSNLTNSKAYKQALPDIIERMVVERDRAISQMGKKISKAKYRDMIESVDKLTKNIQLLNGGNTMKGDITFSWEADQLYKTALVEHVSYKVYCATDRSMMQVI